MPHPLLEVDRITEPPGVYLHRMADVFACFDDRTQDSGNISYGLRVGLDRFFVKTAGLPDDPRPYLTHPRRVLLLQNAIRLANDFQHPALPPLRHVIADSPHGPLLVYNWLDGELLGGGGANRDNLASPFHRFRALPTGEIIQALDVIFDVHGRLALRGWTPIDFYDGCLIYDFPLGRLHLIDLDHYADRPFINEMGRMFGSTRFMAPEEFQLGARIDQRTTVFTMGRTISVFLSDGTLNRDPFRSNDALYEVMLRACRENRDERFASMAEFSTAWARAILVPNTWS